MMKDLIKQARQLCGCMQCQGGYDIGARTIAAGVKAYPADAVRNVPSSCVAAVVLQELFTKNW